MSSWPVVPSSGASYASTAMPAGWTAWFLFVQEAWGLQLLWRKKNVRYRSPLSGPGISASPYPAVGVVPSVGLTIPTGLRRADDYGGSEHLHQNRLHLADPPGPGIRRGAERAMWRRYIHTALRLRVTAKFTLPYADLYVVGD